MTQHPLREIDKKVLTKRYPLKNILKNDDIQGDVIINFGAFKTSSIIPVMRDVSTMVVKRNEQLHYDEYRVITRPFPWLRLLLPSFQQIPFTDNLYCKYCELNINNILKIVIFQCGIFDSAPNEHISKAISKYINDNNIAKKSYFIFANSMLDSPWCRILMTNVEELPALFNE